MAPAPDFVPGGGYALPGLRSVRPAFNVFTTLAETAGAGGLKIPPVALPLTGATALCDLVARLSEAPAGLDNVYLI